MVHGEECKSFGRQSADVWHVDEKLFLYFQRKSVCCLITYNYNDGIILHINILINLCLTHGPHLGGIGFGKCRLIVIVPLKNH